MRQATGTASAVDLCHLVVASVAIDDERALRAAEHFLRRLAATIDAKSIGDERACDEGPNVRSLRRAEHLDAGLVTEDELALPHALEQSRRQWRQQLCVPV